MSLWSRIFGGGGGDAPGTEDDPVAYEGYSIIPAPVSEGPGWRVGARIEREVDGHTKVHHLIRADTPNSRDEAVTVSVAKAKQAIDQMGDRLFD